MCTYCDRAYAASGDLVKHLRTHVGEKTYFCDQCPLAFKYSTELKDHKNQHYKEKAGLQPKVEDDVAAVQQEDSIEQQQIDVEESLLELIKED